MNATDMERLGLSLEGGLDGQTLRLCGQVIRAELNGEQAQQAWSDVKRMAVEANAMLNAALAKARA